MTQEASDADSSWASRLGEALDVLTRSVTGVHGRLPELPNEHYLGLARQAENHADARIPFNAYFPKLNSDPQEAVDILKTHPVIRRVLDDSQDDDAVMMLMPRGAFRVELEMLVCCLSKASIRKDSQYAANTLARYLALSEEKRLPGHEITLFGGLEVDRRFDLCEGAFIAPYEEVVQLGLLQEPEGVPWEDEVPDFRNMGAAALVRGFTSGPGVGPAMTSATPRSASDVDMTFSCLSDHESPGIALDVLSVVTRCRIQVLARHLRGAEFMEDTILGFGRGALTSFTSSPLVRLRRSNTRLKERDAATVAEVLGSWVNPDGTRDHVVRRLASAVTRSGRFGLQDGILDLSIALESMYRLDTELKYKLATRAGYLLGTNAEDRTRIFKALGKCYDVRSAIIHGRTPSTKDAEKALEDGFEVARDTFFKLLRSDPGDWDSLVMSGVT